MDPEVIRTGGGENGSRAHDGASASRWGARRDPRAPGDTLDWVCLDPFDRPLMGETAENLAEEHDYRRQAMDEWGLMYPRRGLALERLAPLTPTFRAGGAVTAGSWSGVTRAALVVVAERR